MVVGVGGGWCGVCVVVGLVIARCGVDSAMCVQKWWCSSGGVAVVVQKWWCSSGGLAVVV